MKLIIISNFLTVKKTIYYSEYFSKQMDMMVLHVDRFCYFKPEPIAQEEPDVLVGFIPAIWGRLFMVILTIVLQCLSQADFFKSIFFKCRFITSVLQMLCWISYVLIFELHWSQFIN